MKRNFSYIGGHLCLVSLSLSEPNYVVRCGMVTPESQEYPPESTTVHWKWGSSREPVVVLESDSRVQMLFLPLPHALFEMKKYPLNFRVLKARLHRTSA